MKLFGHIPDQSTEKIKEEMIDILYLQIENGLTESEMKDILKLLTEDQLEEILFDWFD